MKKLLFVTLSVILTACSALNPAATPTLAPTASPVVLVQTVIVTVIQTVVPTAVPSDTPSPTFTPQMVESTATLPAASPTPTESTQAVILSSGIATATLPTNAGGAIFTNLSRSSDHFSLRCQPGTVTFYISSFDPYVVEVDFYYRIEDQLSISISDWKGAGKMQTDSSGNFMMDFSAASVSPDLRSHKAWFDYQFVGINKLGQVVGRSAIISKQITYTIDCSD